MDKIFDDNIFDIFEYLDYSDIKNLEITNVRINRLLQTEKGIQLLKKKKLERIFNWNQDYEIDVNELQERGLLQF
jgi:hypothetical protein